MKYFDPAMYYVQYEREYNEAIGLRNLELDLLALLVSGTMGANGFQGLALSHAKTQSELFKKDFDELNPVYQSFAEKFARDIIKKISYSYFHCCDHY